MAENNCVKDRNGKCISDTNTAMLRVRDLIEVFGADWVTGIRAVKCHMNQKKSQEGFTEYTCELYDKPLGEVFDTDPPMSPIAKRAVSGLSGTGFVDINVIPDVVLYQFDQPQFCSVKPGMFSRINDDLRCYSEEFIPK